MTNEFEQFDYGSKNIRRLVRYLDDPRALGLQQFAKLAIVEERLSREGLKDTAENRGLVLSKVVKDVVEEVCTLRPNVTYARMLHEIVFSGKTNMDLADLFTMSNRTVNRYVQKAYSLLGGGLMNTQAEATRKQVESSTKEPPKEDYKQYLRRIHPDWSDERTEERLVVTDEVLRDLSGFVVQSRKVIQ